MQDSCLYFKNCKKYNEGNCPIKIGAEDGFCVRKFKIEKLKDYALLTEKQRERVTLRLDRSGVDRKAYNRLKVIEENICNFVDKGKNLYLYSSKCGVGKTLWSLRLLNTYLETIWYKSDLTCRGLFISVPNLLITTKENFSNRQENVEHVKKYIFDADLVVWDDISTKGFTEFETETIFNYIDGRLQNGKSNIYTSNVIGDDLRASLGDRLFSRIETASEVVVFNGLDKRGVDV